MLVVVDMQEYFLCKLPGTRRSALMDNFRRRMEDFEEVILVEYSGYGRTIPEMLDIIGDRLSSTVQKDESDGSHAICAVAPVEDFVVGGLNTTCCVLATVYGLRLYHRRARLDLSICEDISFHRWIQERIVKEYETDWRHSR